MKRLYLAFGGNRGRWRCRAAATTSCSGPTSRIKAAWAEVLNQYQRRADLIPNLVNTVKGFAAQEQQVLLGVTNARAKVGSIQATPELINDPAGVPPLPAGAGRADPGAVAAAGGGGELSRAEVRPELPRPAGAARRHREPHHRRAQPLHQGGAGVQRPRAPVPINLTAMVFGYREKPQFTVENERAIARRRRWTSARPRRQSDVADALLAASRIPEAAGCTIRYSLVFPGVLGGGFEIEV